MTSLTIVIEFTSAFWKSHSVIIKLWLSQHLSRAGQSPSDPVLTLYPWWSESKQGKNKETCKRLKWQKSTLRRKPLLCFFLFRAVREILWMYLCFHWIGIKTEFYVIIQIKLVINFQLFFNSWSSPHFLPFSPLPF